MAIRRASFLYATSKDGTLESQHIKITVPKPIEVESITAAPSKSEISLGEKITTSVTVAPSNADNQLLSWSTSDETIATVDSKGTIYAIGAGSVIITVSSENNVSDSFKIFVDGSKRIMNLSVSKTREDDHNIGNDWIYITEINGESTTRNCTIMVGDVINLHAKFTESDNNPDVGESYASHIVTENDLMNGFEVTLHVYVTENGGKNSGKTAHFVVIYMFTP